MLLGLKIIGSNLIRSHQLRPARSLHHVEEICSIPLKHWNGDVYQQTLFQTQLLTA